MQSLHQVAIIAHVLGDVREPLHLLLLKGFEQLKAHQEVYLHAD
jgi:hypothetical protein